MVNDACFEDNQNKKIGAWHNYNNYLQWRIREELELLPTTCQKNDQSGSDVDDINMKFNKHFEYDQSSRKPIWTGPMNQQLLPGPMQWKFES